MMSMASYPKFTVEMLQLPRSLTLMFGMRCGKLAKEAFSGSQNDPIQEPPLIDKVIDRFLEETGSYFFFGISLFEITPKIGWMDRLFTVIDSTYRPVISASIWFAFSALGLCSIIKIIRPLSENGLAARIVVGSIIIDCAFILKSSAHFFVFCVSTHLSFSASTYLKNNRANPLLAVISSFAIGMIAGGISAFCEERLAQAQAPA